MKETAANLLGHVLSKECIDNYLELHQFTDVACGKMLISKLLGFGIILGAVVVKVPQILKMLANKSAKGLAPSTYILENIVYAIMSAYYYNKGYPFSAYGENVFLLLQGYILVFLVFKYNEQLGLAFWAGAVVFTFFVAALVQNMVGMEVLTLLQGCSIPVTAASRVPQIVTNFKNGSTGQLSAITSALLFLGCVARVFTTLQEVSGDNMALLTVGSSTLLNGTIFAQILYYWKAGSAEKEAKKNK